MENRSKKEFLLLNLSCASCAAKMEDKIAHLEGVENANVDFALKKLRIEVENPSYWEEVIPQAKEAIQRIEFDTEMKPWQKAKDEEEEEGLDKKKIIRLGIGFILFIAGILLNLNPIAEFSIFFIAYLLAGGDVLLRAGRNIVKGQIFDENFLMSIATIGAFAIGEYPEGVAVMIFYQLGELFQDIAVNRSRRSIAALMDIRPDYANLKVGEEYKKVDPEEVKIGDIILIRPGEKVPLDGIVRGGRSSLDTSAITGESLPREVEEGSEIVSGSINHSGLLTVEVQKDFGESTVSKILDLVQNASSKKAPTEQFITKFARYYTPVVVFTALALAILPPLFFGGEFSDWLYRALVFLVVSCPCALVISIPLGFFGGIGGASRKGILVKGSNYLEALNDVDTVVFDKTGTLTKGVFQVTKIHSEGNYEEEELLEMAAFAEGHSSHPIAQSILKAYGKEIPQDIEEYEEIAGHGIRMNYRGREILVGNRKLLEDRNIQLKEIKEVGTLVYIAIDNNYEGYILIADELKEDAKEAVSSLRKLGVREIVMLTGDSKEVGEKISSDLKLDTVYSQLLPDEKVEKLESLEREKEGKGKLAYVGDGINDAPVIARADVGIAMGGLGSDAAIEAADIVIMTDEPSKIATAIQVAKHTRTIVYQNIFFALFVKGIFLFLGTLGLATMWEAVFADVGVAIIAIINATRAGNIK